MALYYVPTCVCTHKEAPVVKTLHIMGLLSKKIVPRNNTIHRSSMSSKKVEGDVFCKGPAARFFPSVCYYWDNGTRVFFHRRFRQIKPPPGGANIDPTFTFAKNKIPLWIKEFFKRLIFGKQLWQCTSITVKWKKVVFKKNAISQGKVCTLTRHFSTPLTLQVNSWDFGQIKLYSAFWSEVSSYAKALGPFERCSTSSPLLQNTTRSN